MLVNFILPYTIKGSVKFSFYVYAAYEIKFIIRGRLVYTDYSILIKSNYTGRNSTW